MFDATYDDAAFYRSNPSGSWSGNHTPSPFEDKYLDDLDRKFDALCEFLGVEFVFEKISDGSENADSSRWYCRKKKKAPLTDKRV